MLLDGETLDLVQHVDTVLAAISGHELETTHQRGADAVGARDRDAGRAGPPAMSTASCARCARTWPESRAEDRLRVGSAGTHPFSLFERQRITARDRYRHLDRPAAVRRAGSELIFGLHIHVARRRSRRRSRSSTACSRTSPRCSRSRLQLARSGAASATGLSSSRQMVFAAFPRSGPPPRFSDYADYAEVVGQLEKTGCIADYTHIWWDIRLHPRLGTVEIRVCDAVTRVEDAVALAAFCQALVKHLLRAVRRRRRDPLLPPDPDDREQVACRALRARGAGDGSRDGPARNRVPVAQLVRRTLRDIEPHARETRLRARAGGSPRDPRPWQRRRPSAADRSTPTATSSRSSARSRTRPRRQPPLRLRRSQARSAPAQLGRQLEDDVLWPARARGSR